MLYFRVNSAFEVAGISAKPDYEKMVFARKADGSYGAGWLNRNDMPDFAFAEKIAASASKLMNKLYIATDSGPNVSPRYDVIEAPAVGDEVSYAFNGDAYPCGKIVKISESLRVIEVSEFKKKFYRRGQSGCWKKDGWSLIPGVVNERNPSF
jgi:hypothetical protein